ncbi:MAG: hypothetical protein WCT05_14450 [Lentisphaeria bacterium]
MKKLVLSLVIVACVAASAAEFKHPGWNCKDVTLLQEQLTLAPTEYNKLSIAILIDFAQNGTPETIESAFARINVVTSANDPTCSQASKLDFAKQWARSTRPKMDSASIKQFCIDNPSSYDLYIGLWDGYEDFWSFQVVSDCLLKNGYSANYVIQAIDYLNRQAIALGKSDEEVLDLLKKLNRTFSANLIKDKEVWGPIVAQIRTMMETYK